MIKVKNPNTKEFFDKESIREIVREWFKEYQIKNWSFTDQDMEDNIELLEQCYMRSLHTFVTDTRIMYTSTAYYKRFLKGEINQEYISILRREVKRLFLETCVDRALSLSIDSMCDRYLCTETVEGLFYKGEIYKCFLDHTFCLNSNKYGVRKEGVKFHLVPQGGYGHYEITKDLENKFKKL